MRKAIGWMAMAACLGLATAAEGAKKLTPAEIAQKVATLDEEHLVVYEPEGEVKQTITVWTHVDCPKCRKVHPIMKKLVRKGTRVRYAASGFGSEDIGETMRSIWCAEDRRGAMDAAKRRRELEVARCDSTTAAALEEQRKLGKAIGGDRVPMVVSESGDLIFGWKPKKFQRWEREAEDKRRKMEEAARKGDEGTRARPVQPIEASARDGR